MALLGTFGGTRVYSDKKLSGVNGTRVTFSDGSWCDTQTRKSFNVGPGYISFDQDESPTAQPKTVTKTFVASALVLRRLRANVDVTVAGPLTKGADLEYSVTGPADAVDRITANVAGGSLVIEGGGSGSGSVGNISIDGDNISIGGNVFGSSVVVGSSSFVQTSFRRGRGQSRTSVVIGGSENLPKVTVRVPSGTPVTSDHVNGDVQIGDTRGPLVVNIRGANDVTAGTITSAHLNIQGSGDVSVESVEGGDVVAYVQGSGDIDIDDGNVSQLDATVQGSGDISFGGTAQRARLSVQGSGDIQVKHVVQPPMQNQQGSGRIRVRRVG